MWHLKKWVTVLLCSGLLVTACGKDDDKDNDKKKGKTTKTGKDAKGSKFDKDLVGTWGIDGGAAFKFEKSIESSGNGEQKVWENGSLVYHTENRISQPTGSKSQRFVDKVVKVKVAKGSFADAAASTLKCLYSVKKESAQTLLTFECDEDYPKKLPDDATTLIKN